MKTPAEFSWKLWLYTNFDCNLRCRYCVAESSPEAPRRPLGLNNVRRFVDEAAALDFERVFLTGGEPFILDEIYAMAAYAAARVPTTILTNGMLLRGRRLQQLAAVAHPDLSVQVSLDGADAVTHDAWRGQGSWQQAVTAIRNLQAIGIHVVVSTTETPANADRLDAVRAFCRELGIAAEDHLVRPLAKRGFSDVGLELGKDDLLPEITVTANGIFWHPLISPQAHDMQLSDDVLSLAEAMALVTGEWETAAGQGQERSQFT